MKRLRGTQMLEAYLNQYGIRELFDTPGIEFDLFSYEQGEVIAKPFSHVFFQVHGSIRVYALFETGETVQINYSDSFMVVGDLEFAGTSSYKNFYEAATDCQLVGVSLVRYGDQLRSDVRFLWTIIDSINQKLWARPESLATFFE